MRSTSAPVLNHTPTSTSSILFSASKRTPTPTGVCENHLDAGRQHMKGFATFPLLRTPCAGDRCGECFGPRYLFWKHFGNHNSTEIKRSFPGFQKLPEQVYKQIGSWHGNVLDTGSQIKRNPLPN